MVTVGIPSRHLNPNSRCHWAIKAKAVKSGRVESWTSTQVAMHEQKVSGGWIRTECEIRWYAQNNRRRDADNCLSSLKATLDGVVDAGLLKNDSGLSFLPMMIAVDPMNPRVELRMTRVDD